MNKFLHIVRWSLIIAICTAPFGAWSQNESILDFTVKELNGDTIKLRDRLESHNNYLIETMAFWCNPCIKSIERFHYQKQYWKERFNIDILLIEDEHWDDIAYVVNEMEERQWDLDIVVSNDQYSTVGINSIPRYYFKSAEADTVERIHGSIERFFIERLDTIKFTPILTQDFKQVVQKEDCDELYVSKFYADSDTLINGVAYKVFNDVILRENEQNGDLIRYIPNLQREENHIKFSAALCSRLWLRDFDGDSLMIKILDRYQKDSILHIVTDQLLLDKCHNQEIPFEFIQNIGSNAGLDFDIVGDQIKSRLVCHEKNGHPIYEDQEIGDLCSSVSTAEEEGNSLRLQIYPNPTVDKCTIHTNFQGKKKIFLLNSQGMLMNSFTIEEREFDLSLPKNSTGFYILKMSTSNGVFTRKILLIR